MPIFTSVVILGFPIALVLAWAYELTPQGIKRTEEIPADAGVARAGGWKFGYAITGLLALAVTFIVLDRYVLDANDSAGDSAASTDAEPIVDASAETRISVAVLPFRNLSSDPEQAYFADGLSEQLLNSLKQIPELLVTERASSFAFKDSDRPIDEIAGVLGVQHVLGGSVRKDGSTVRIATQLTRVTDGAQLWSETYDFEFANIFAIQDSITESVAKALSVTLGVLGRRVPGLTRNVAAFDEFLRARSDADEFTPDSFRAAIDHYQRAIALDSSFSLAFVGLSTAYYLGPTVVPDQAELWRRRGAEAFAQARLLTPDAPAVLSRAAQGEIDQGNWSEAAVILAGLAASQTQAAVDFPISSLYGGFLLRVGRTREAIEALEQARAVDPLSWNIAYGLGEAYADAGDIDAALAEFDRGLGLEATSLVLITGDALFVALGSRDRAEIERRVAAIPRGQIDVVPVMATYLDDPAGGVAEIRRRSAAREGSSPLAAGILAQWAAYYGAPELAIELMLGIPNDSGFLPLMLWNPNMREVRPLPQFRDLVTRMGLVPYWREYGWPDHCQPLSGEDFECK
jgi:TolB-like protein